MNVLYDWKIEDRGGYLHCTGYWANGKGWITSPILSLNTWPGYYVIYTENSTYYLYF